MKTPLYLGPIRHPAIGIRIPEIFLTGIVRAYKKRDVAGGLMLSYGRETAPESVIDAPPGTYQITLGHTGTSIKKYITMAAEFAQTEGTLVEIEADHIMVTGSSARAVKRIAGIREGERGISDEELRRSMDYNALAIDEALSTGYINSFTTDTSDLLDHRVDSWSDLKVKEEFRRFPEGDDLLSRYLDRKFVLSGKQTYSFTMSEIEAMRLALKSHRSIAVNAQIYDYIKHRIRGPFGFEISLDETVNRTRDVELFFYLNEWRSQGRHVDFVAPNIGFKKRRNFYGDLKMLQKHVARLAAVAKRFGALLSIHSGSGTTPYSSKGRGTYTALLDATGRELKYKISGVYYELLLQILASYPTRSKERRVYDEIFDGVYRFLQEQVAKKGPIASRLLKRQLSNYRRRMREKKIKRRDPRAMFFRFNSYLALNLRDGRGDRYLRQLLVQLYRKNQVLRRLVDQEVDRLTLRLIDGLGFSNNVEEIPKTVRSCSGP